MIQFNHNNSLINSDLVTPTGGFNFTCKVSFHFFNYNLPFQISIQHIMSYISKHFFPHVTLQVKCIHVLQEKVCK